jgi:hypothetical protein
MRDAEYSVPAASGHIPPSSLACSCRRNAGSCAWLYRDPHTLIPTRREER